jgi:phage baseplate assembly protein W
MTKTSHTADFLGRGWKFAVAVANGSIVASEGEEKIRESILIILGTSKGERVMRPEFGCGINDLVFEVNSTATTTLVAFHVKEALQKWEPRIEVLNVFVSPDEVKREQLNIEIDYEVILTNSKANLVYPFFLEGKNK